MNLLALRHWHLVFSFSFDARIRCLAQVCLLSGAFPPWGFVRCGLPSLWGLVLCHFQSFLLYHIFFLTRPYSTFGGFLAYILLVFCNMTKPFLRGSVRAKNYMQSIAWRPPSNTKGFGSEGAQVSMMCREKNLLTWILSGYFWVLVKHKCGIFP